VRSQPGAIHVTAQTGTKSIYTLCAAVAGACNVAGQYRINWYFNQGGTACGTPTPGQVTFEVSYTDNAGAHTTVALPMNDNSSIAVFTNAFKFAAQIRPDLPAVSLISGPPERSRFRSPIPILRAV